MLHTTADRWTSPGDAGSFTATHQPPKLAGSAQPVQLSALDATAIADVAGGPVAGTAVAMVMPAPAPASLVGGADADGSGGTLMIAGALIGAWMLVFGAALLVRQLRLARVA
jgi:hypothetical protein